MVDKIINNIKLPNGEVYAVGGGGRYGIKGDYSTHYGIEYCQHGLIDNPVGTTDIVVKGGMMLCLPGADTKTTIGSDITYTVESTSDVTIFYADGNILEAGEVHYSLNEPADNGIDNYLAWWNPDFGKWQFKSNDTGNVWREAIATPVADIHIEEGSIVRIDYIGYRILNDDIYGLKSETATIGLDNLTEDGEKHFLNKSQITNCLLEVPQRVKLELNDGVLTLKAGSQVIVPNGFEADGVTPRFDYVDIESDITHVLNYSTTDKPVLMWAVNYSALTTDRLGVISSGTTPSNYDQYGTWYDTNANIVKYTYDSGATWISSRSLPIAILNTDGANTFASIDQVFNGFGYIGSTVWVDKGVKGLIPNGRNEDGTLRNIEFVTDKVMTTNLTFTGTQDIRLSGSAIGSGNLIYNSEKNWNTPENGNELRWFIPVSKVTATSGVITNFTPKQTFRAVDYSDKSEVSGWSFPSNKYIDLTLNASNAEYTAPSNGYVYFSTLPCTTVGFQSIYTAKNGMIAEARNTVVNAACRVSLKVSQGDKFRVSYDTQGTRIFRFIYAQGEVQ